MSLALARREIERFLGSPEPEVLCITGSWGVGKTFTWNKYLREFRGKVALSQYSYVSLFGQTSLHDVRLSIVENAEPTNPPKTFSRVADFLERASRSVTAIGKHFPGLKDYTAVGERIMFAFMPAQIVCLDDLERAGSDLTQLDVMGLASQLKEQKLCKVVILLNRDKLADNGRADFDRLLEKVVDTTIVFDPTPEESSRIGVGDDSPVCDKLRDRVVQLSVRNIRVIKQTERLVRQALETIPLASARAKDQVLSTVTLASVSKLQPGDYPPLSFLRRTSMYGGLIGPQMPPEEQGWRELLTAYGYTSTDDLDSALIDGVERGYFDGVRIQQETAKIDATLQAEESAFSRAWSRYHESFDLDHDEVLDDLAHAFRTEVSIITPLNADGTIRLFRELGRDAIADELIEMYLNGRGGDRDAWDLNGYAFADEIRDATFRASIAEKYQSMRPPFRGVGPTLLAISRNRSYTEEMIEDLTGASEADYYEAFKVLRGDDLGRVVREAVRFRNRGEEGGREREIARKAESALERISTESPMNARRVLHKTGMR